MRKHEEDPTILGKDLNLHREMEVSSETKAIILEQLQSDVKVKKILGNIFFNVNLSQINFSGNIFLM